MLPTRISVCTAPGDRRSRPRRVGGGGSSALTAGSSTRSHEPNARSAPGNASSGVTSPTIARIALLAPNQRLWNARRSSRVMAAIESGVPESGLAVRMKPVDQPIEDHAGEIVGIVVADLQARQDLLTLPLDFLGGERRMAREVGHEIERERPGCPSSRPR